MQRKVMSIILFLFLSQVSISIAADYISLGCYIGESSSLYFVGEKKGFFNKNNINFTLKAYDAGKLALEDVIAEKLDFASISDFAFVAKSFNNTKLRIILITGMSNSQQLIVRKDRIKTISDLKNKNIAIMKNTSSEFAFGTFLDLNQLKFEDINLLNLKPPQMIENIKKGDIDGVVIWEPTLYKIKTALKENIHVLSSKKDIAPYHVILATTIDVIQKKSELIQRFIKSLIQAENFLKNNEKEVKEIVKTRIGADDDYINYVWGNETFNLSLPQSLLPTMEDEAEWMIEVKLTDKKTKPSFLNYIYLEGLNKEKPDSISIIH
ncbi:MAG: ABC transporter substrate-binding protein [Desulfobacterales bacterium]|nr:ABC transporter substrate-binding protein [Desulfobacterales bacterium]